MNDAKGLQKSFDHWLDQLIGSSSSSSPTLNFNPDQKNGRLRFLSVNAESLYRALRGSRQVKFKSVDTGAEDSSHASSSYDAMVERPEVEIQTRARDLKRRADEALSNQGVAVLYVAFGMLTWTDVDNKTRCSPLLLVPVELVRAKEGRDLLMRGSEDDVILNPVLNLRLDELGVSLPMYSELEDLSYADSVDRIETAIHKVSAAKNWRIEEVVCLSMFSFAKESMYRDLKDNKEKVLNHPIVKALGTSNPKLQSRDLDFEAITVDKIDEIAPPEATPLVLDADSSQRVAIAEAARGRSFVMDGPPGTGKSQTIANMISVLLNQGKTVLFVSEKMAALEVVRNRLTAVGLGDYLLELHSHKVNRKGVAKELLRVVDEIPKAPNALEQTKVARARALRESLNDYAIAVKEDRKPAGLSVHTANGLIAQLSSVTVVSTGGVSFSQLTWDDIQQVTSDAARMGRNWRVYTTGDKFIWRGVKDSQPLEPDLQQAHVALDALRVELQDFEDLRSSMNVNSPKEVERLILAMSFRSDLISGDIRREWLMAKPNDYKQVLRHYDTLVNLILNHNDLDTTLVNMTGLSSAELDSLGLPESQIEGPAGIIEAKFEKSLTSEVMSDRARVSNALGSTLSDIHRYAFELSKAMGLGRVETISDARMVASLADKKRAGARFPAAWVRKVVRRDVEVELNVLGECIKNLESCEAVARTCFTDAALALPVADLRRSVAERNWFVKIFSALSKEQASLLASTLVGDASHREGLRNLTHLEDWQQANEALTAVMTQESSLLIDFGRDPIARFNGATSALADSTAVAEATSNEFNKSVGQYFEAKFNVDKDGTFLSELQVKFKEWDALRAQVAPGVLPPEVIAAPISAAADWLNVYGSHLERSSDILDKLNEKSGRDFDYSGLVEVISAYASVRGSIQKLREGEPNYTRHFGKFYKGVDTDLDELANRLERAGVIRESMLSEKSLSQIVESPEATKLRGRYDAWRNSAAVLNSKFETKRVFPEFGSALFAETAMQLDELLNDLPGQQSWLYFNSSRKEIEKRIGNTALTACLAPGMTGEKIADTLKKTLLFGWVNHYVSKDSRLQPVVRAEREAMVKEYRAIDLQLLGGAVSGVIQNANARRNGTISQSEFTVIRSQGSKKTRHRPVRSLISETKAASLAVKPVFMMSPGAVSQYLPPDIEFDVVIFDEASQVKPSEAINCIYRGKALILAGDERQLPPTPFFGRSVDVDYDEDSEESSMSDYESILSVAKGSGALKNLGLRWHYRSKHESLISYSNNRFYDGSLITFPSAAVHHPDFGVAMIKVEGVYKGGGSKATNPIEAEAVAARVMQHFLNRPQKSLGVVTMSKEQAEQVNAAVEKMRLNHPELDNCFELQGRLDNFFVRSIEEVQGDERDVIIMSIGYGPDVAGKVHANFGPLGKTGGERRLNVAITRARERLEVVTSMTANDIAHHKGTGAALMKSFLDYAERGLMTLALPVNHEQRGAESPFEEMVLQTITSWGYEVVPQVGAAGYRIDIGVCHPDRTGQFVLAVECDGYQYHSSPAARDRDRLRDQILVGLGWTMHRIWGTNWHRHRADEEKRLKNAIENAIAFADSGILPKPVEIARPVVVVESTKLPPKQEWAVHYTETRLASAPESAGLGTSASVGHLKKALADIVKIEAPVHLDLVYARIRECFNLARLHEDKKRFVRKYIPHDEVDIEKDFLVFSAPRPPLVRTQPDVGATRTVSQVHVTEVARALYYMAGDLGPCTENELIAQFIEFYGWRRNQAATDLFREATIHAVESSQLRKDDHGRFTQVEAPASRGSRY